MEMIIQNWITQFISIVGIIYIYGFAVWGLNRLFYRTLGGKAHGFCIATGFIGTPVHELGHAIFCLLFLHKITDMKLFSPSAEDGVLGYVSHSYNRKNIYHQIGNFFIGVGPILFGSAVLFVLMYFLSPDMYAGVIGNIGKGAELSIASVVDAGADMLTAMFKTAHFTDYKQWVFFVLAILITLHMSLSPADMKGSAVGTGYIAVLLLLVNAAIYFLPGKLFSLSLLTAYCVDIGLAVAGFLTLAVLVAAALALIGFVLKTVLSVLGR
ncbi:MAG: hypothetical protein IKC75_07700 [Clostridia bacterium]|nr:hypothetical protein [Clostridia bacterium]